MSEQLFPMLEGPPLPWPVAAAIWRYLYAANGHGDQSLERIAERGGFGYDEIQHLAECLQKRREQGRTIHAPPPPPPPPPPPSSEPSEVIRTIPPNC